jgi:hypothetical protein
VNALFGGSINLVVSQVEITTSEPTISTGSRKVPEIQIADNFSYQRNISPKKERWDASLSPRLKPWRNSLFGNHISMYEHEDHNHVIHDEGGEVGNQTKTTFGFPILNTIQNVNMNNFQLSALHTFYGKSSEDPYTFLFDFDILCINYNYLQDAKKLKLFPTTIKHYALRWFMGLREYSIRSWEYMKTIFLRKYQDYWKYKYSRNDIFKIQKLEDESLEDYMERFSYISQKSKYNDLLDNAIRTLFLKGILEEYLETLNMMASGDVSYKPFAEICEMCRNYLRSRVETGKGFLDPYSRKAKGVSFGGITRMEIGNLLENFKIDILSRIGSQLDTLNIKKKQEAPPFSRYKSTSIFLYLKVR